jgi:eukaryotic-like serine/threonine-protein kinase
VHRDLKPANVLVAENGEPKVLDFGVARAVGRDIQLSTMHTLHGQLVGTLAYMSPEQLRASSGEDEIDARSDVYALGVLLYRLLAERLPFEIADVPLPEAIRRLLEDDAVPLGLVDADFRGTVARIVARAMARDRASRYPSAEALAEDLRAYLAGRPVTPGDIRVGVLRREVRRYRFVAAATLLGALGLAGISAYVWMERARAADTAARLETELGTSRIERGRLLAQTGNLPAAEALVWAEYFRQANKDYARWALREIYSRQPVLWTSAAHAGTARLARFSDDDSQVFTGGEDGVLAVWNAATGSAIRRVAAHHGAVRAIVPLTARGWIVTAGNDGAVRAWSRGDGTAVREWPAHRSGVRALAASPDGGTLVSCDEDGTVAAWPVDGTKASAMTRSGATSWTAQFDPSGTRIAIGWSDGAVELRDARTWQVQREWPAHRGNVSSIAFSPDARLIATGSDDRTAHIWNAQTLDEAAVLTSGNGTTRTVAFAPDGSRLAVAGWWRVELWDTASWRRVDPPLGGAESWFDAEFSRDGARLVTASEDGNVRMWQLQPRAIVSSWKLGSTAPPGIAIEAGTDVVKASAGPGEDLVSLTRALGNGHGELLARARTPDGRFTIVSARDSRVICWSNTEKREAWSASLPQPAFALTISPDGNLVAAGLWTGRIEILDARTGAPAGALPGHVRVVRGLSFSEDGRVLASAGSDGALHLWDVSEALLLQTPVERDVGASHVVFLHNGRVAVAWDDGRVDLVDPHYFDLHVRGNEAYQHARLAR